MLHAGVGHTAVLILHTAVLILYYCGINTATSILQYCSIDTEVLAHTHNVTNIGTINAGALPPLMPKDLYECKQTKRRFQELIFKRWITCLEPKVS